MVATAHAERVWGWLLMGGTLTKELVVCAGVSTCAGLLLVLRGVVVGGCGGTSPGWVSGSSSTLLGPQVTGHVVVVPGTGRSVDREPLAELVLVGRRVCAGRGRWLFENCTVDASIFVKIKTHPLGGVVLGSLQFCCFC